jgi:hypothetical protein
MFLAFPLAHVIARHASLRDLGYRGHDPLKLYARGAAVGAVTRKDPGSSRRIGSYI